MWSFFFLAKAGLYFAGYLRFDAILNVLFLAFTLVPMPPAWRLLHWPGMARQLLNGVLAFLLVWHDSWLPPLPRIVSFLVHPNTAPTPRYALEFLSGYADVFALGLAAIALTACIIVQRWHAATRLVPAAAVALASLASLGQGHAPVEASVNQIMAAESSRTVSFAVPAKTTPPFDIILLHVCSMSWEDLEVAGLADHDFFRQFDVVFTRFNAVTSYSGLSAIRLLRSGCGQSGHGDLHAPTRSECYLLDRLRQLDFKTYAAMDHDGIYGDFLPDARRFGHLDEPAGLDGIPVHQYNFDDSPIFDGYPVLERWWKTRLAEPSTHTALYYNTITLHEGSWWNGDEVWWDRDRVSRYRISAVRFFTTLQRFFSLIESSGRNAVVILVPEHGTALRSSTLQAPGLREIPLPQITRVPVAVKYFGTAWQPGDGEQIVVREPVSYFALASLIASIVEGGMFAPADMPVDLPDLPRTPFLAENEGFRVTEFDGRYFVSENHGEWHRLPDRAAYLPITR